MPARLKISMHAQIRLAERGIDIGNVKKVILEPDFTERAFEGKMRARKQFDTGQVLEVIYYKEDIRNSNDYFIVTAYYIQ